MLLTAGEIDWKHEAMKRENRKPRVFPPPDDGREWILIDDAAEIAGVLPQSLLKRAKRENWTRTHHHHVKTWLLKKDFDNHLRFVKNRERWCNRRRPKNWQPEIAMNPREEEELFKRIFLTTAQAAAYMGVGKTTVLKWVRQGKIPVYLTRKKGRGGRNWYSTTNLRNLKGSEEWQRSQEIRAKVKATMQQGIVAREVYKMQHKVKTYPTVPQGWITEREAADRLQISINAVRHHRRMQRLLSDQFVGKWNKQKRPWFIHEDSVEELKNNADYQKARQRRLNTMQALPNKPLLDADPQTESSPETYQPVTLTRQHDITFGYTNEELKMPRLRVTGINDMW